MILNDNYYEFIDKYEKIALNNEVSFVFNGKGKPYDIIYIDSEHNEKEIVNTKSTLSTEGKVTFYDTSNFSTNGNNNFSTFWLTSSVNYYNKTFNSIHREYNNNIGSGGITNLKSKVSSIKMQGNSKVSLLCYSPCGLRAVTFRNSSSSILNPLETVRYIKLKDVRLMSCPGFWWSYRFYADNRSYRAIISY